MSANNWAVCPRCLTEARKAEAAALAEVMDSYGKVPVHEFDRARRALVTQPADDFRTFREDYDIDGATAGLVTVSYRGGCQQCGLALDFKHSHPIPGLKGDDGKFMP